MSVPTAGGVVMLKFYSKLAPQFGITIRHYALTSLSNPTTWQTLNDAISTSMGTSFKACMGAAASFFGTQIYEMSLPTPIPQAHSTTGSGAGGAGGDVLPSQVSSLISLRTGLPGRKYRGRAFIPFPSTLESVGTTTLAVPTAAFLVNLALLAAKFLTLTVTTADAPACVAVLTGQIYHRAAFTFTPITGTTAQPHWATQKRRGDYGKQNANPF